MSSSAAPRLPRPLAVFFSRFPLKKHPRIPLPPNKYRPVQSSTLWLSPPLDGTTLLSADVECLKWQAYIALRGLTDIRVRFDVSHEGALEGHLPNVHVPLSESVLPKDETKKDGELLAAQMIPTWVDARLGVNSSADENEGYVDENAKDESRAWVALLEGTVHATLVCILTLDRKRRLMQKQTLSQPKPSYWYTLLFPQTKVEPHPVASLLTPPPAPLTGYFSLLPPWGTRISHSTLMAQYRDAIASLSERLGTDKWFLGSACVEVHLNHFINLDVDFILGNRRRWTL
jgi:metaxin